MERKSKNFKSKREIYICVRSHRVVLPMHFIYFALFVLLSLSLPSSSTCFYFRKFILCLGTGFFSFSPSSFSRLSSSISIRCICEYFRSVTQINSLSLVVLWFIDVGCRGRRLHASIARALLTSICVRTAHVCDLRSKFEIASFRCLRFV